MESGNSSSMQSSSGGDDQEYESNFPTTVTNTNTSNLFMFSSNSQHQPYLNQQQPFGEPNFQNIMFWQQPQLASGSGSGSGSSIPYPPPTTVTTSCTTTATTTVINPQQPPPLGGGGGSKASTSGTVGSGNTSTNTKNPRKRTRASRRAPTTVLTTDTTNFRAMVQEFTGIPSSPFSAAASPLLSRRLNDLFAPSPATTLGLMGPTPSRPVANTTTSNLDRLLSSSGFDYHHHHNANAMSLPSPASVNYPFRPSAQKPDSQMPVFLPKITNTATGSVPGSGLNMQDPGINNPTPDLRYPSGGLFTAGTSHFNELLMGNEQQQQQQQHILFSPMIQHDAFPGVRLGSEPDPVGGSIPRSPTSTNDDQDGNNIPSIHTRRD